jgi:hypothetical protein
LLRRNKTPQAFPAGVRIEFYQSLKQIRDDAGRIAQFALRPPDQWLAARSGRNGARALTSP